MSWQGNQAQERCGRFRIELAREDDAGARGMLGMPDPTQITDGLSPGPLHTCTSSCGRPWIFGRILMPGRAED